MNVGENYTPDYECVHAVATEYATIDVDLGDAFDCDHFSLTFMRRMRKLFHLVDKPEDWCLVMMTSGRARHIGVVRYGRVKHNWGAGATGAVVSSEMWYIKHMFNDVTFWKLNDTSNVLPDKLGREK